MRKNNQIIQKLEILLSGTLRFSVAVNRLTWGTRERNGRKVSSQNYQQCLCLKLKQSYCMSCWGRKPKLAWLQDELCLILIFVYWTQIWSINKQGVYSSSVNHKEFMLLPSPIQRNWRNEHGFKGMLNQQDTLLQTHMENCQNWTSTLRWISWLKKNHKIDCS